MRKIRVAFFADMLLEDFDGCIRTIQQLVNRIPEDQFEFLYLTGVPPEDEKGRRYEKLSAVEIPFNRPYKATLPFLDKTKMKKILKDFKPDIIHVSNPSMLGTFAANYAQKHQIPLTTIYHTHYIKYVKYYLGYLPFMIPFVERQITKQTKKLYEQCDIVYVPVTGILEDFKTLGINTDNCKLWPRGIDRKQFKPSKRNKKHIVEIVGNQNPNILFASRLVWEKNLETLIQIYDLAEASDTQSNFVIAGDGRATEAVKQRMPNAHFLGSLDHDDLSVIYASSDVFVFPSDTETYGNVIIEAMASGLPSIAANHGGPTGIISDGENGFLCESHDPQAYWKKIRMLLNDADLYQKIRNQGIEYTASLSWERLTEIYFSDLRRLYDHSQLT